MRVVAIPAHAPHQLAAKRPPHPQALNGTSLATENPEHNLTVAVLPHAQPTVRRCIGALH